jgi:addiction module HigA family antidote
MIELDSTVFGSMTNGAFVFCGKRVKFMMWKLLIITERNTMTWNIHPGEILKEEFMRPLGLSSRKLAGLLGVPAPRINDIVLERRGISAETALRLAHYFNTTPKFWMNMQIAFELRKAESALKEDLSRLPFQLERH